MNSNKAFCPNCDGERTIQSLQAIISDSTSLGSFSGTGSGMAYASNDIEYSSTRISVQGEIKSSLAIKLSQPECPELYKASGFGIVLGILILVFLPPLWLIYIYGYFKNVRKAKERYNQMMPKYDKALEKWKKLYYCHQCHLVINPDTGETCHPDELMSFIDFNYEE